MNNDVVIIQLDRPRKLKFGHIALKTLVEITGHSIEEIDQKLDVSNFEFLEQMVYCGLLKDARENGEKLTLEQMSLLLDESPSFSHTIEKVISAWRITFGSAPVPEGNQGELAAEPAKEELTTGKKANG